MDLFLKQSLKRSWLYILTKENIGDPATDEELRLMIKEADLDGDGMVSYSEFMAIIVIFG